MTPDWTKGFDVDLLKARARIFKEVHGPHVYGAFGLVKERDVATALSEKRLFSWPTEDAPEATLLWRKLQRPSVQSDFRGKSFVIDKGLVVSALAARSSEAADAAVRVMLRSYELGSSLRGGLFPEEKRLPFFVEIFEEDKVAQTSMQWLGLHWMATKVMAGSEVKGMYSAVAGEPLPSEEGATLQVLRYKFVSDELREPILAALEGLSEWAQHYSSYNKRKSWTGLSLRGYSDDPFDIVKPAERDAAWKEQNAARLKDKPRWLNELWGSGKNKKARDAVKKIIEQIPNDGIDRVRFLRLRGVDGELTRHADITDREAGVQDGKVARLHIPLITHPGCIFSGWTHRGDRLDKHLPENCLAYLDQRKPHAVVNRSPRDRIHLVIDVVCNEATRDMLRHSAGVGGRK